MLSEFISALVNADELQIKILNMLTKNSSAVLMGISLSLATFCIALLASSIFIAAVHSGTDRADQGALPPRIFSGRELVPVSVGSYEISASDLVIRDFDHDQAIFALPQRFESSDYPFIELKVTGNIPHLRTKLMWETAADNQISSQSIELSSAGHGRIFLGNNPRYQGSINSIALLFFDGPEIGVKNNGEAPLKIHSIKLVPLSASEVLTQLLFDRFKMPLLGASSNNLVREHSPALPLTPTLILRLSFLALLFGFAAAMLAFPALRSKSTVVALTASLATHAVLQDAARWKWRYDQHEDIAHRYTVSDLLPATEHTLNYARCAMFPADCGAHLKPYF